MIIFRNRFIMTGEQQRLVSLARSEGPLCLKTSLGTATEDPLCLKTSLGTATEDPLCFKTSLGTATEGPLCL